MSTNSYAVNRALESVLKESSHWLHTGMREIERALVALHTLRRQEDFENGGAQEALRVGLEGLRRAGKELFRAEVILSTDGSRGATEAGECPQGF